MAHASAPAGPASAAGTAAATRGTPPAPHPLQQCGGLNGVSNLLVRGSTPASTALSFPAAARGRQPATGQEQAARQHAPSAAGCAGVAKPLVICSVCVSTRALAGACGAQGAERGLRHEGGDRGRGGGRGARQAGGCWARGAACRGDDRSASGAMGQHTGPGGARAPCCRPLKGVWAPTLAPGAGKAPIQPRNCLTSLLEAVRRLFASIVAAGGQPRRRASNHETQLRPQTAEDSGRAVEARRATRMGRFAWGRDLRSFRPLPPDRRGPCTPPTQIDLQAAHRSPCSPCPAD